MHPYIGAFIEGIATLLCRLSSYAIADLELPYATFVESFIGTGLVVAG